VAAELAATLDTAVRHGVNEDEITLSRKSPVFIPRFEPFAKKLAAMTSVLECVDVYAHSAGLPPMLGTNSCGGLLELYAMIHSSS
jgi:hypothetical protein